MEVDVPTVRCSNRLHDDVAMIWLGGDVRACGGATGQESITPLFNCR